MIRPSLQTIADQLRLSRSTISRSLRDDPRIPPETRTRVQALAREIGYRPNTLMSEIASSHWQAAKVARGSIIGYVDCIPRARPIGFTHAAASARERASALGYRLETFHREDYDNSAKLQRALRNQGITDVILGPVYEQALTVELEWSKFIAVQLLPATFQLPLHSVLKDHFSAVVLAWRKAVSRGYRRIGLVLPQHPMPLMDDILRLSAGQACQQSLFPQLTALPILRHALSDHEQLRLFSRWVKANQPDVIIAFTDTHYYFCRSEFGREMPYISLHRRDALSISGIPGDEGQCAKEAVDLLHFCRRTYQWGIPERRIDHVVEPAWFEGTTLPPNATP